MKYGKGYKKNPAGTRRVSFKMHASASTSTTPSSCDLTPHAPSIMDQGPTGSCTGHGTSCGLVTSFSCAGTPIGFVPSPDGIYGPGRAIASPGAPLEDQGAMPSDVEHAVQLVGIRPMRGPTSDGRNSDCDPATINDPIDFADLEKDATFVPVGIYEIQSCEQGSSAAQVVAHIRSALAAGFAVAIGMFVDTGFENWTPSQGPLQSIDENDPDGGGHWTCLVGYRTEADGTTSFLDQNSWSESWGDHGRIWLGQPIVKHMTDITVYVPKRAA